MLFIVIMFIIKLLFNNIILSILILIRFILALCNLLIFVDWLLY